MSGFTDKNKSYISYDEHGTHLINTIDEKFRNEAFRLGALEYHIPALIEQAVLEKCGYFSSFPQHLTAAAYANPNIYQQVTDEKKITNETAVLSSQYLTPAACLHIYPMLEGEQIEAKVVTTKARVYRYEDANFNGTTRLWDFTVREIVFIGNKDFVIEMLQNMKSTALEYAVAIGLPAKIVSATDNFYPTKRNSVKQKLQISNSMKFELIVSIDGNDVAIASFNFHESHFSKPFNFDQCGEVVTGCVGFGLERWVEALNYYRISL